jgi:hypothetical protein
VVPQAGRVDPYAWTAKFRRLFVQQDTNKGVVVDDYVHALSSSGEIRVVRGHVGGKFGVATSLFDRIT